MRAYQVYSSALMMSRIKHQMNEDVNHTLCYLCKTWHWKIILCVNWLGVISIATITQMKLWRKILILIIIVVGLSNNISYNYATMLKKCQVMYRHRLPIWQIKQIITAVHCLLLIIVQPTGLMPSLIIMRATLMVLT